MSKLKDSSEEYSSTKYTPLTTTSSSSSTSTKIKPPLWNTFEFYIYYVAVAFSVFYAFKSVYDLSQETHPNYSYYSKYLSKGWMFGRKLDNTDTQLATFRNNYFLLAFALIIYLIIIFEGSIFNPSITWIFNLSVLFLNEGYSGYKFSSINDHLEFLRKPKDAIFFTETERIITPCCKEDYNFIYYLSYILYTPLFLAGPIITYNDFISQLRYSRDIDIKGVFLYGIRLLGAILLMEVMLHYIYVVVIGKARAFWAMADGIIAQENMMRCMMNNYSTSGFWRRGNKNPVFNILVIFTFVALWHDISLKLLAWGWLIWLFILPEKIGRTIFSEKKWGDWPYYRHLCAVGAVANLLMMWMANLIGFAIGLDGMKVLLINIFMTKDAVGLTGLGIFCGAQIMFEIREEEKRKGINQEIRY
ncbi:1528_t:CDS:10 [Diversispora eburnea]|uniref:1528_t:CDS:1 n=1 Tax=Diversispora eburnea TaxID=1213867 RepID=A0A9N9BQN6_9GLOM|nr:1528_t:CDS:10 [Diversispora eburnea]